MARKRLQNGISDGEASESDADHRKQRHKKRREAALRGAPYLKQYHIKKGIEKELDDIDFWNEKRAETSLPIVTDSVSYFNYLFRIIDNKSSAGCMRLLKKIKPIPITANSAQYCYRLIQIS